MCAPRPAVSMAAGLYPALANSTVPGDEFGFLVARLFVAGYSTEAHYLGGYRGFSGYRGVGWRQAVLFWDLPVSHTGTTQRLQNRVDAGR